MVRHDLRLFFDRLTLALLRNRSNFGGYDLSLRIDLLVLKNDNMANRSRPAAPYPSCPFASTNTVPHHAHSAIFATSRPTTACIGRRSVRHDVRTPIERGA